MLWGLMKSLWKATGIVLIVIGIAVPLSFLQPVSAHQMGRFASYADLMSFVQAKPPVCSETSAGPGLPLPGRSTVTPTSPSSLAVNSAGSVDYSATNVQVQGVDELDTVKTDEIGRAHV